MVDDVVVPQFPQLWRVPLRVEQLSYRPEPEGGGGLLDPAVDRVPGLDPRHRVVHGGKSPGLRVTGMHHSTLKFSLKCFYESFLEPSPVTGAPFIHVIAPHFVDLVQFRDRGFGKSWTFV